ncbi:MAG: hypothetical protein GY737_15070 [Desulfobacteraceae bacterium]|nr:hypothetical protein [Desulfobacteraceae bacterium]
MTQQTERMGAELKERLMEDKVFCSLGIVNLACATAAEPLIDNNDYGFFLSGLAKSYAELGLPDEGHIRANTVARWTKNMKRIFPDHHLIVDIDEGFGPITLTKDILDELRGNASAVQYDDQDTEKRKCGHLPGKVVIPLDDYLRKLEVLLKFTGDDILFIARTDEPDFKKALVRAKAFSKAGAPIVLVDGVDHPEKILQVRDAVNRETAIMFNYIQGGKSRPLTFSELKQYGGNILNYSIPFLLPYMEITQQVTREILSNDGYLESGDFTLRDAVKLMKNNWDRILQRYNSLQKDNRD